MRQLFQLGRKRNLFKESLPAATFGLLSMLVTLSTTAAQGTSVTEVPPFVGTHSETWEEFPVRDFGTVETIFGGAAVISGTRLETATYHMFLLCAYYASPTDGEIFMGADQYGSSMTITFSQPVSAFGAYWANIPAIPAGCGGIDTSFAFVDAAGNPVGEQSYPAGNTANWHWHGWVFATPVKTITITGDYVVTDGMQATVARANSLSNISTRLRVGTDDNAIIGGFIVTGNAAKNIALRGIGPSLAGSGITDALADPILELRDGSGALLVQNNNWQDDPAQVSQLTALGLAPQHPNESGIVASLQPGSSYTAILRGRDNSTGTGLVEAYDTNQGPNSQLANISTRGLVQTGVGVMIGGFILGNGSGSASVAVRGIGPSLSQAGVSDVLADPTLELHDSNGALLASNDNWQDDPASAAQLISRGLAPQSSLESGIFASLPSGAFTAILAGRNGGTGVGLVEIYNMQ